MSEERLKEIHDSIEFQMQLQQAVGYKSRYDDLLVEEIDLYNEVIDLQQENQQLKEVIEEVRECIESKNNGVCIINGEEKGAYTFLLDFDKAREFVWELLQILDKVKEN